MHTKTHVVKDPMCEKKKKKKKGEKALSFFFLAWIFLFWGVHSSRCGSIGFWLSIFD